MRPGAGAAVPLAVALIVALGGCERGADRASAPAASAIGGAFRLIDTDGRPVTDQDLRGRPTVVFFGFTYCPEVCPTTLGELTAAMATLGAEADRLNVVFISVDPERDTPEALKTYLSNFDPRIRGLTGTPQAVAQAAANHRVYYRKVPTQGGGYTIDHSSMLFLFDSQGAFVEPVSYGESVQGVTDSLRRLIRGR